MLNFIFKLFRNNAVELYDKELNYLDLSDNAIAINYLSEQDHCFNENYLEVNCDLKKIEKSAELEIRGKPNEIKSTIQENHLKQLEENLAKLSHNYSQDLRDQELNKDKFNETNLMFQEEHLAKLSHNYSQDLRDQELKKDKLNETNLMFQEEHFKKISHKLSQDLEYEKIQTYNLKSINFRLEIAIKNLQNNKQYICQLLNKKKSAGLKINKLIVTVKKLQRMLKQKNAIIARSNHNYHRLLEKTSLIINKSYAN